MARFSPERGCELLTVDECVQLSGKSRRTICRFLSKPGVYVEYHMMPAAKGKLVKTTFIDPLTLPIGVPNVGTGTLDTPIATGVPDRSATHGPECQTQGPRREQGKVSAEHEGGEKPECQNSEALESTSSTSQAPHRLTNLIQAQTRLEALRPLLELPEEDRPAALKKLAKRKGLSERTIRRRLERYREKGLKALGRKYRGDRGRPRIPAHAYELVVSALLSNPPTTPLRMIHRTLMRAVPDAMTYEQNRHIYKVSSSSVTRIKRALLADPHTAPLFHDDDARKEYLRTYSGQVVSAHANDLWIMDMTRCDTLVVDPETGDIFRPRVHSIIDVYSGCIPGLAFSREENQTQTDLALLRAILPKSGPWAEKYPIFGVPKVMYWDNGKTYTSSHSERVLSGLGVENRHSPPRVSHTRGKKERWYGSLHLFEKSLPGYVGPDAKNRASETEKRLTKNTKNWLKHGRDPGEENRLPTITEYQNAVLAWLVAEYHQWIVNGKSRLEHFTSTAPESSRIIFDQAELMLLFAERTERTVEPGGTIRLENRRWAIPDGSLIRFQGYKVLVLRDQFALGNDSRLIAFEHTGGKTEIVGEAIPAPEVAHSLEAGNLRRASKAQAQEAQRKAKKAREELRNPELRVSHQLLKEAEVVVEPAPLPSRKARLAAVNPPEEENPYPDFGKSYASQMDIKGKTPDEILKEIVENTK